jgi:hypothetical protein
MLRAGAIAAVVLMLALSDVTPQASAQNPLPYGYNYYVAPSGVCLGSSLYPCPRPTPPYVGHTYITYQALNPQEFLYPHHRAYYTHHPSGTTRTCVAWTRGFHPLASAMWGLGIPVLP